MAAKIETVAANPWGCSKMNDKCMEAERLKIYVQPKKRQMHRPLMNFCPQTAKTERNSTYRLSYKPMDVQCHGKRPGPTPTQSPWPTTRVGQQFDCQTVHRASFPAWPGARRALVTLPHDHELACKGCGPMQAETSQRHDYVSKNLAADERCQMVWPTVHLSVGGCPAATIGGHGSGSGGRCPMNSETTTAVAFGTRVSTVGRRPSARPSTADSWSVGDVHMAADTETSSNYRSWGPQSLTRRRGAAGYCRSSKAVSDCTVYAGSYRPPGVFRDPFPGERPPATRYDFFCSDWKSDNSRTNAGKQPLYPRAHHY